jgi:hypothetical protein
VNSHHGTDAPVGSPGWTCLLNNKRTLDLLRTPGHIPEDPFCDELFLLQLRVLCIFISES